MTPTFSQIRAQVLSIHKKHGEVDAICIHTTGKWSGEREMRDGDRLYTIDQCDSPLALREALRRPFPSGATRVLLTRLDESELSEEIRLRLAKRRLFRFDRWQVVRSMFQAHAVDTRVMGQPWMADLLLQFAAADDCPAAPGGFLDSETVWTFLLERGFEFSVARPDLPALLRWTLHEPGVSRFRAASPEFREGAIQWLIQIAGPAAELVLRCVESSTQVDALTVGTAAQVVFHPAMEGKLEKAVGRMEERFLGGRSAPKGLMRKWGEAAREVLTLQIANSLQADEVLRRADVLLRDIQADACAWLSDVSILGFNQRLERLGGALRGKVEKGTSLEKCFEAVQSHFMSRREARRVERTEMAMRLLRWLQIQEGSTGEVGDFPAAVEEYMRDGAFADTARLSLRNGDAVASLSEAFSVLARRAAQVQERKAKVFAALLRDWGTAGSSSPDILPVERVLDAVLAPLGEVFPVLLIVMDGMSVSVFHQLMADPMVRRDWVFIKQECRATSPVAIATIPSVTEFSRTSLLCGERCAGDSTLEKAGFSKHAALSACCKAGRPPLLFHKAALHDQDDGGLSVEIRSRISSTEYRVVGVVINAIDDYLLKGEQLDQRWGIDGIKALPALFHEAKAAGRAVVLTSDHGHILEVATTFRAGDAGDRWREATGAPEGTELLFEGPRVVAPGGKVLVPWSESVRYAGKKNGYHGGVSPQEMVVPIAALVPEKRTVSGWVEVNNPDPIWWNDVPEEAATETRKVVVPAAATSFPESLLDWREEVTPESTDKVADVGEEWIDRLLSSPVYHEQKLLAGRSYPTNEQRLREVLRTLHRNGNTLTLLALSNTIDYPPMRLPGLLAVMQKVLNLDGYEVLRRDAESETVVLNMEMLLKQFELD